MVARPSNPCKGCTEKNPEACRQCEEYERNNDPLYKDRERIFTL